MYCRVCLHKNMKIYYNLNNNYIDLMETITEVKMTPNDLVCCFCLGILRKIEKFTKTAKEVDSILKLSIKYEEDVHDVNKYYNLVVSYNRNISIDCSRALYETYACNIKDELLTQVERDLVKMEDTADEPHQLSEDTLIDNGSNSKSDVPLLTATVIKEEQNNSAEQNDEPHQLSEDSLIVNASDSKSDVPLLTATVIKEEQNNSAEQNEAVLLKQLKRSSSDEENNKLVAERPSEEVVQKHMTCERRNKIDINDVLTNEISKQNYVATICSREEPFSCDTCAYRTKYKSCLKKHLRTHKSEKSFACNICSYKGSQKGHLREHLRTHTGEKPFSCNICSYKCSLKKNLRDHLRTHTGEKPFACNICSYKCGRKSHLTSHLRTHTGEKPFACNICSFKCNQKSSVTKHLKSHSGEKPFSCNICLYKCSRKSSLTRHLKSHSGESPFHCDITRGSISPETKY